MNAWKALLTISCLALVCAGTASAEVELPFKQTMNVVYGEVDGVGLVMDVFTPTGKGIVPMYKPNENGKGLGIIDIASGGWHSDRGKINDHKTAMLYSIMCARLYTVFAVRPGSMTKFTGVEMLRNINTAIRYVKEHAEQYGIDPDRLGITGASAGGHLACLAVVNAKDGNPDAKDPLLRHSTHVKAAGIFFPVTDFLDWDGKEANFERAPGLFFHDGLEGHTREETLEMAEKLSPLRQIKGKTPPFIFFHGDADPLVPLQQSQIMVAALKAAGNSAELIVKKGGQHPWLTIPEEVVVLADWFDKELAGE